MKIELLSKYREQEYTQLLLKCDRVLMNSSLKFRNLLGKITGAEPYYLIALEDNAIVGILPAFLKGNSKYGNVLNSLPWYGSNPGITVDPSYTDHRKVKVNLLSAFNEFAQQGQAVTSTIITRPFGKDQELYDEHTQYTFLDSRIGMITEIPKYTNDTDIDTDIMSLIHSKTRNLIRKAQKSNIEFSHDDSTETLHFLADLHRENMDAIGVPPKSRDFFDTFANIFCYDNEYRVYVARKDGLNIAALLVTYFSKTVGYFTPAVHVDYRSYQPLNLLIFNAIKDASQMGLRYWNWGGTAHSAKGVYHFKKRWGSQECTYYYYIRSYDDISTILSLSEETLLREYPYFYVVPFSQLICNAQKSEVKGGLK